MKREYANRKGGKHEWRRVQSWSYDVRTQAHPVPLQKTNLYGAYLTYVRHENYTDETKIHGEDTIYSFMKNYANRIEFSYCVRKSNGKRGTSLSTLLGYLQIKNMAHHVFVTYLAPLMSSFKGKWIICNSNSTRLPSAKKLSSSSSSSLSKGDKKKKKKKNVDDSDDNDDSDDKEEDEEKEE